MPALTRLGDSTTGHGAFPPRPSTSASSDVMVNGKGVVIVGSSYAVHCNPVPVCHGGSLAAGHPTVMVNGKMVGRVGDPVSCGDSVAAGSPDVMSS